jgi:hypothetical protein
LQPQHFDCKDFVYLIDIKEKEGSSQQRLTANAGFRGFANVVVRVRRLMAKNTGIRFMIKMSIS